MKNREMFEALQKLLAIIENDNAIEKIEAAGQQEVVSNVLLAKEMEPNREIWEQLGFVFVDIPGDDVLCRAILPTGWSIEATDHSMWNEILDEEGRVRAKMFYKAAPYDRKAHMFLGHCYSVHTGYDYDEDGSSIKEVYFGNERQKLFVAGQIHIPENASIEVREEEAKEEEKLRIKAEKFGNENYPGWEDILSSWSNGKKVSNNI